MLIPKTEHNIDNLYKRNEKTDRVEKYLGTVTIKIRIGKARTGFMKKQQRFNLEFKVRLMKFYIPILYYYVVMWKMKKRDIKNVEAFKMWLYGRILRFTWMERMTNIEVFRRMKKRQRTDTH